MIMTLTEHDFIDLTNKYSQHKDNFSYEGKKALFRYIGEFEEGIDANEQKEYDYIALWCDYSEYENLEAYNQDYNYCETLFQVQELTLVIPIDSESFIIQQF